jgi:hypothetical protein
MTSVTNCVKKITNLKDKYHATQRRLSDMFGKSVSKRLAAESPAKEKKRNRSLLHDLTSHDESDKENLGVSPLSPLSHLPGQPVLRDGGINWHPPMVRSCGIQTDPELPQGDVELWVRTHLLDENNYVVRTVICEFSNHKCSHS